MMKTFAIVLFFLCVINVNAQSIEDVDYVDLGATLLKDGYTQRAKTILDKVNVAKPNFDFPRYYSLKGILLQRLGYPELSNIFFNESINLGQDNPSTFLYIARNNWQSQNFQGVVDALELAGDAAKQNKEMFVIKAESFKQLDLLEDAWLVLDEGIELFPEYSRFYRQKFYYLLELGFFQQALDYADRFLERQEYSAKDYLAVAYTLRENSQFEFASELLEEAVYKYPDNEQLIELLGQVYIDQESYTAAALVYDYASLSNLKFAEKSSALYLKSRQPIRSLQINRRVLDQKEKFKQRVGIDIYLDDYESLVSKEPALKRYDLLSDDNIRYAIGFAFFRNGEYEKSTVHLKQITDSQLFERASYLLSQIEKCENEPEFCS